MGDPHRLDLKSIIVASRAATGLTDIGEPDVFPGMAVLLDSLIKEAKLSPNGIEGQRTGLISLIPIGCVSKARSSAILK